MLLQIPDPKVWILTVFLNENGRLKTFGYLKVEFTLPNQMFFRYLQLCHALHGQFDGNYPLLPSLDILTVLKGDEPRKLI